ncbi:MAG: hypothetical protein PF569_04515, partial [Candidatus Woesearchaeota archaeon]|jgi:hypothetical protein|nr:hypothetical protein [Candidatus Woesearchaeota archaeon]
MFSKNATDTRKGELNIWVKCPNSSHEPSSINWHSFKSGRGCHLCNKGTRWTPEAITDLFRKFDLEIKPTDKKINSYTYTEVVTKEGYFVKTTPKAILDGVTPCILTKNPHAIHNIKIWAKLNRPDYKLVSDTYSGDIFKELEWEYLGGGLPEGVDTVFSMQLARFMHNRLKHPNLFKGGSRGEIRVKTLLDSLDVDYIDQVRYKDCRDKSTLPFDFGVLNESSEIDFLIEYDGAGHYRPIQRGSRTTEETVEGFKIAQKHDKIKTNYCKDNNIPLLRIPYWEFDNLEKIITEYLETKTSEFLSK